MDTLKIGTREFRSRLILGTGKYRSFEEMRASLEASGAEMITVALRRLDLSNPHQPSLLDYIDPHRYVILPNTAGCKTVQEAVQTARLAAAMGLPRWVKLESVKAGSTITDLLQELNIAPIRVVAQLDGVIVSRSEFDKAVLQEGCKLEIVTMVGGG